MKEEASGRSCNCGWMHPLLEIWHQRTWRVGKTPPYDLQSLAISCHWLNPTRSKLSRGPRDAVCRGQPLWAQRRAENGSEEGTENKQHRHWLALWHCTHKWQSQGSISDLPESWALTTRCMASNITSVRAKTWSDRVDQILEILKTTIHCWDLILWEMGRKDKFLLQKATSSLVLLQFWSSCKWFSDANLLQWPGVKGTVGVHGLWTLVIHRGYSGHFLHFLLLVMVLFETIIDESRKNQIFIFN